MDGYVLAWLVIVVAAAAGALSLWFFAARWIAAPVRLWLVVFALAFFLLPAPIPQVPGGWAPAFVIAIFELLFQIDGQPQQSLVILGVGLGTVAVLCVLSLYRRSRREDAPASD